MEALKLKKFQNSKLENEMRNQIIGNGCGTKWSSQSKGTSGTDHYFDDNENGSYDPGEPVFLDDGRELNNN